MFKNDVVMEEFEILKTLRRSDIYLNSIINITELRRGLKASNYY
jgi:hypothetical protein